MPPKYRRRKYTKRGRGRRRNLKRKGKIMKPIKLKEHTFIRKIQRKELDLTGTSTFVSITDFQAFRLSDLINVSDYTNLFEMYKIHRVKLTFRWMLHSGASGASSPGSGYISGPMVQIIKNRYALDHATTDIAFQEKSQVVNMRLAPYSEKTYSFKPNLLTESYRTSTTTGYSPSYDVWLNCDDTSVPHYGLDVGVNKMNVFQGKIAVDVDVCFSCKGCE